MSRTPPKLTMEQSEAIERQDCKTCGKPASETVSGRHAVTATPHDDGHGSWSWTFAAECVDCWNASVERARAERKAELAARPDCEACGKRKQRYDVKPNASVTVGMCGPCAKRAQWKLRQPMLFGAGWGHVTRESLIAAARAA